MLSSGTCCSSRQPCPSDTHATTCSGSDLVEGTRTGVEIGRLTSSAAINHRQVYASLAVDLFIKSGKLLSVLPSVEMEVATYLVARILRPQRGFALGSDPVEAASKMI